MKKFIFFARVCTWLLLSMTSALKAQHIDPYPNYVVIGAFASEKNALFWTKEANGNRLKARFEINPNRNLFYVYTLITEDREVAFEQALKLRKETKYFDTWVYSGSLGKGALVSTSHKALDFNPVTQQQITALPSEKSGSMSNAKTGGKMNDASVKAAGQDAVSETNAVATQAPGQNASGLDQNSPHTNEFGGLKRASTEFPDAAIAGVPVKKATPKPENAKPLTSADIIGKNFYFQLFRASNNDLIEGDVDAIDVDMSRRMATYKSNVPVKVILPMGKSKLVSFVSDVFGYRKLQKDFDPDSPSEEFYLDQENNLVIPFELVRLQKGDIAIMYNVFFFKDAGVMRPESRYEVNNLHDLLKENPSYKIVIHGHTNGNSNGKILSLGNESENFYSLSGTREGFGSAKKLSGERAEVMKKYLVSKGIDADRMQIKAWGGKKPIHDKHAVRANENVRVEIEILTD